MRVDKDQDSDGSEMTNLSSHANKEPIYESTVDSEDESTLNSKLASASDEISILVSLSAKSKR